MPKLKGRVYAFTLRNPINPPSIAGFNIDTVQDGALPLGEMQDYATTFYHEWFPNALYCITASTFPIDPERGGLVVSPNNQMPAAPYTGASSNNVYYWNLQQSNIVGRLGAAGGTTTALHDGIAVAMPGLWSWIFQYNHALLPSGFWNLLNCHKSYQFLSVELVVKPKHVRPWPAGPTVRWRGDISTATVGVVEGNGQAWATQYPVSAANTAQSNANAAFLSFKTRVWKVSLPRSGIGINRLTKAFPAAAGETELSCMWMRWSAQSALDRIQQVTPDALLRRCKFAKLTNGGVYCKRKFYEVLTGQGNNTDEIRLGAVSGTPAAARQDPSGLDFTTRQKPRTVPPGGYYPAWYPALSSTAVTTKTPFLWPDPVPMCEMVVDTNEWTGIYSNRDPGVGFSSRPQDFTVTAEISETDPLMMNPPMEWDVFYRVKVRMKGNNGMAFGGNLYEN